MFSRLIALVSLLILGKAVSANPLQAHSSELIEVPHVVSADASAATEPTSLKTLDLSQGHAGFTNATVGGPHSDAADVTAHLYVCSSSNCASCISYS
ncbi:hypothetical protein A0H81_10179 [Grifola frondosa]|uniref:Uncharacterized protein n=1 Tax=Grifola frondosa TaxID=5627 RepID=A0A1C7LYJ8_GRIFR|nr:hypothetical protein A0H81_10179 [Grifola frondosa]